MVFNFSLVIVSSFTVPTPPPPGRHILALLFVHLFRNMINIYLNLIIVQLYFHPVVSNPIALMPVLQWNRFPVSQNLSNRACPYAPTPGPEHDTGNSGKNWKRNPVYHRDAAPWHPWLPGNKLWWTAEIRTAAVVFFIKPRHIMKKNWFCITGDFFMSDVKQLLTFPMIRLLQSHYRHKKLFSDRDPVYSPDRV